MPLWKIYHPASDRPRSQQRLMGAVCQRGALSDPLRETQGFFL